MGREVTDLLIPQDAQRFAEWLTRLFDQIRALITQNPVPFITALLGIFGSALLGHLLRRREQTRAEDRAGRTEHFNALKQDVLVPTLAFLDDHVLPILRIEVGNVDVCIHQVPNTTALAERPVFEQVPCIRAVTEPLQVHIFGMGVVPELPRPPEGPLVEDARQHHFPDLFRKWEAVVARFDQ